MSETLFEGLLESVEQLERICLSKLNLQSASCCKIFVGKWSSQVLEHLCLVKQHIAHLIKCFSAVKVLDHQVLRLCSASQWLKLCKSSVGVMEDMVEEGDVAKCED